MTRPPHDGQLRILFVCSEDFSGASVKQATWFAEELLRRGHAVMVSIAGDPGSASEERVDRVEGLVWRRHSFRGPRLSRGDVRAARTFAPTLVHAWNPRVAATAAAASYHRDTGAALFVHWEDDEWSIRADPMGRSPVRRVARVARRAVARVVPSQGYAATCRSLAWTRDRATGLDALTPMLAERVSERLGRDCAVVFPALPESLLHGGASTGAVGPSIPSALVRRQLVVYTGSIHPGTVHDLEVALQATAEVRRRGHDVALVHAGAVLPRYDAAAMSAAAGLSSDAVAFLGYVPFSAIPPLLDRATVAVQPGPPTELKRFGLPSKLMAYLASGTPTITLATGFGELLEHGVEALKVRSGDPAELADRIVAVLLDERLRRRLATGAIEAARRFFDPVSNVDALEEHYQRSLAARMRSAR